MICRRSGVSDATFYTWRSRFGGMEVSDASRLKAFDEENRQLKLRGALGKTSDAWRTENGSELAQRRERLFAASCLQADRP